MPDKHDAEWFLAQAREIFEVIGWPEWESGDRKWRLYAKESKKYGWQWYEQYAVYNQFCCSPNWINGAKQFDSCVARFARDYLREKIMVERENSDVFMQAYCGGRVRFTMVTYSKESPYSKIKEGEVFRESINEALIDTALAVFMGGKWDE